MDDLMDRIFPYVPVVGFLFLSAVFTGVTFAVLERIEFETATDQNIAACTRQGGIAIMAHTNTSGGQLICIAVDIIDLKEG